MFYFNFSIYQSKESLFLYLCHSTKSGHPVFFQLLMQCASQYMFDITFISIYQLCSESYQYMYEKGHWVLGTAILGPSFLIMRFLKNSVPYTFV